MGSCIGNSQSQQNNSLPPREPDIESPPVQNSEENASSSIGRQKPRQIPLCSLSSMKKQQFIFGRNRVPDLEMIFSEVEIPGPASSYERSSSSSSSKS